MALLAQTCSQIGADPTPTPSTTSTSSSISVTNKSTSDKPSKKPSETNENKSNNRKTPPTSSNSSTTTKHQSSSTVYDPYGRRDESTNQSESHGHQHQHKSGFKSPGANTKSSSTATTSPTMTSSANSLGYPSSHSSEAKLTDAQRAALEAMQQQSHLSKDIQSLGAYRPSPVFPSLSGLSGLSPYHHPGLAGLDAATAAALGAFRHPAYSAAAHLGYPPVSLGLSLASYQQALNAASYGRLGKSPADSMSVCRDPYCTGCPSSVLAASQSAAAAAAAAAHAATTVTSTSSSPITTSNASSCPAGCTQCDHIRTTSSGNSLSAGLSITSSAQSSNLSIVSSTPSTIVTSTASPDAASVASRPYVCNWIAADHYCGKRFTSSEELLQHLRTHTSLSVPVPTAVSAPGSGSEPLSSPLGSSSYSPLLNPSLHPHSHLLAASSALHRTYPTPPLSPLSMARYHPYSKPPTSASPLSAAASIPPPPPNPLLSLHHPYAGLGAYYSTHPYSLYSQRMLAGAGVLP